MLSRPPGSRSRKYNADQNRCGSYTAVIVVVVTLLVTLASVRELGRLLELQNGPSTGASGSTGGWHSVLDKAETNMETHLPHWRSSNTSLGSQSAGVLYCVPVVEQGCCFVIKSTPHTHKYAYVQVHSHDMCR